MGGARHVARVPSSGELPDQEELAAADGLARLERYLVWVLDGVER
jgi:hypothetical protein